MFWTSYPADIPMPDSLNVNLLNIQNTEYTFYFRLNLSGQSIDIFSKDKLVFYGEITNWIKEYDQVKINNDYRTHAIKIHVEKIEIDSSLATSIANQIIKSGQPSFPTDTLINSWHRSWYLHCGSLKFEIKNEGKYIKQSYNCPWRQPDSVEYKDLILTNYNILKQELKLDSIYTEFMYKLPKGKIYSRNAYGMTYIFTKEQEEAWEKDKPRRDYMKSIRDTINSYLRTELEKQKIKLNEINCFEDYWLTFSKNGKLSKLTISEHDKPKLSESLIFSFYIEDVIEIRKCKKIIRKIFKKIDLSSFDLKYKVYRTISFGSDGEIHLKDNTIY